jgi:hypothetical protein
MHVLQVLDFHHVCCLKSLNGCKCSSMGTWVGNMIIFVASCNVGTSMGSWANNMIIFDAGYNTSACHDGIDNISPSTLVVNTWSTICKASLNHPLCKGGFTTLTPLLLMLGVGYSICWGNSILWALISCPWTSIASPWIFNFHPLVLGRRTMLHPWKLFIAPIFIIIVQSTFH